MKRTHIALGLVLTLSIGTYFATAPSAACCGDGAIAAQGAIAAGSTVSSAIGSATTSVVQMLQQIDDTVANGFGKLYQEMSKQTAAEKTIQEGVVEAQTQIYLEDKRAEATQAMKLSPRACYELQAAGSFAQAAQTREEAVQEYNQAIANRTLYTPNTAGAVDAIFRTHAQKYCSTQDARLGRCSSPATADMQNADIRADNLLSRDVLNPDQEAAAVAFAQNVVNPMPTQMLPSGWEKTDAGRAFLAGQLVEQGRLSAPANSIANMIAMRRVQPGLGTAAGLNQADVSMKQLIRSQTDGRFLSQNWYRMVGTSTEENLMRELNKQMAFSLWLDYQAYEQMERLETSLAVDAATNIKRDSEQRLSQARSAAAKAR